MLVYTFSQLGSLDGICFLKIMNRVSWILFGKHTKAGSRSARLFATQLAPVAVSTTESNLEWSQALPYDKIPGPSPLGLIKEALPGGRFATLPLADALESFRQQYGDIYRIPGLFGKPPNVMVFDPKDFETIYRTEGAWPIRQGLDSMEYYRKKVRPDLFPNAGLAIEQGKAWAEFRTTVNPAMMQPKNVRQYVPRIDQFASEFIDRMKAIRIPTTQELPENFEEELNRWTLEAIGIIAFDARLGLIGNVDKNSKEMEFIDAMKSFFQLVSDLDLRPSLWRVFPTPTFKKMMRVMDIITEYSYQYVLKAKERIAAGEANNEGTNEQSVLEKLVKIDPKTAVIMGTDMVTAGVDTTSSAITSVLYNLAKNPDKQEALREEIRTILPDKDSPLTPQNMSSMPYLRACIKEALRLMPVVNANARQAGKDIVLKGYQIPKGTALVLQAVHGQQNDKTYMDAKKFHPERWLKHVKSELSEQAKSVNPFTYLPFGFGPRTCIGRRFAELEIEVFVSRVIRNFKLEWNHPDLKFKTITINIPDSKLQFKITDVAR